MIFWDRVREDATADETVRSAGEANTRDNGPKHNLEIRYDRIQDQSKARAATV